MPSKPITIFEHGTLYENRGEPQLKEGQLKALQLFNPNNKLPYYSLIHNGVRFCEYVGVIQVGKTIIEVLPKADKGESDDKEKTKWRDILISMLKVSGDFEVRDTSTSTLRIKPNSILDLYFEKFINEVEYLYHNGLIKKYRKTEGNKTALKGRLIFSKDIQKNLVHKERFYVNHTVYDYEHLLHVILYKALKILNKININATLASRIGALLLLFPEMPDRRITLKDFERIVINRKTIVYKNALGIAKLILLNYHPDIKHGRNDVLALMFDMNKLWEKFVYMSLRRELVKWGSLENITIRAQHSADFWKPNNRERYRTVKADIVIKYEENIVEKNTVEENTVVLDTKWKNIDEGYPADSDLQQMFVYNKIYKAKKAALVYPGNWRTVEGEYKHNIEGTDEQNKCSLMALSFENIIKDNKVDIRKWQENIAESIFGWAFTNNG